MPVPVTDFAAVRRIKSGKMLGDVVMDFKDNSLAPPEIMQVLQGMTLGGSTEQLHLWELEKCAEILETVKASCPTGKATYEECGEHVDLLLSLMAAKHKNSSEMVYDHLPQQLQAVFKCWDLDGSGTVSAAELHAAAGAWNKMSEQSSLMKKLLMGAGVAMLIMFVGVFVLSLVTAELSKEFKARSGTMVDSAGAQVRVANSGFDVSNDGTLEVLDAARRLAGGESSVVATSNTRKEKALHSALANTYFDALDEITVHSEKGHTLSLKVSGFARIPVLGSRCGNIVHLFSSVDGHLTLDSSDLSLNGKLEVLFEQAGFELVVGGAAGRRLQGVQSVSGFFNHVKDVKAAGWKCQNVPLPRMPKEVAQSTVTYRPCSAVAANGAAKTTRNQCDSSYGGYIVGVGAIPSQHAAAVSTRLDNVRRTLGQDVDADRIRYIAVRQTVMQSATYQVQFTRYANHPKQEKVVVLNKATRSGLSFQRMLLGSFDRTFCVETDMNQEPIIQLQKAEGSGVNASLHMEFLGLVGGAKGQVLRHWRVMPSNSFRKWLVGEEAKTTSTEYFEYWDEADSLVAHSILDSNGALTIFEFVEEGSTDAEVEAALGASSDEDAVAAIIANGQAKFSLTCGATEMDGFHPVHGLVPAMSSPTVDISSGDFDFYVQQLALDLDRQSNWTEADELAIQAAAGSVQDVFDSAEAADPMSPEDQKVALAAAWAAMKTMSSADPNRDFAAYALRSKAVFGMADACADVCADALADAKYAVSVNGEDSFCTTPQVQVLVDCLAALEPPLLTTCSMAPFQSHAMERCPPEGSDRRLVATSGAEADVLADGAHAVDLGSLDASVRQRLQSGLEEAVGGRSLGDLSGAKLLVNSSGAQAGIVISGAARRMKLQAASCGDLGTFFCFKLKVPTDCKENSCKFFITISIGTPSFAPDSTYFSLTVKLGGNVNLLDKFLGIPNPPVYGSVSASGGIKVSSKPACPGKIDFSLEGFVQLGMSAGLNLWPGWIPKIDLLAITLKGGANIVTTEDREVQVEISDRRRTSGWGRRRRALPKKYKTEKRAGECDVRFYVKATVQVLMVQAWLLVEYFLTGKRFLITMGADYYEVWKLAWGSWLSFGAWVVMDQTAGATPPAVASGVATHYPPGR